MDRYLKLFVSLCVCLLIGIMFYRHFEKTTNMRDVELYTDALNLCRSVNQDKKAKHQVLFDKFENIKFAFLNWKKPNWNQESVSEREQKRIKICQETAHTDRAKSVALFRDDQHICVVHHTYLKKNDTVVIEVGGHIGNDTSLMANMYNSRHIILEPVAMYADGLRRKFMNNSRIAVLNLGLGNRTEIFNVKNKGDSTSIYDKTPGNTTVMVMNSTDFFIQLGVGMFSVDLLTMDCEGCELDVIENLLSTNMTVFFKNIQFESHLHLKYFYNNDWIRRYCEIQARMSRTHRLTFQYKYIWENWRRHDL